MVLDQNDNRPFFIQNQFTGSVAEFSVPGTARQPGYRLTGTAGWTCMFSFSLWKHTLVRVLMAQYD